MIEIALYNQILDHQWKTSSRKRSGLRHERYVNITIVEYSTRVVNNDDSNIKDGISRIREIVPLDKRYRLNIWSVSCFHRVQKKLRRTFQCQYWCPRSLILSRVAKIAIFHPAESFPQAPSTQGKQ
jgi:hypothetical protein